MSQKNKAHNKALRRGARSLQSNALDQQCTRRAASRVPREVASRILTEPKNKLTHTKRIRLKLALGSIIVPPMTERRDVAVKVCVKLRGLPLVGVIRLMKKSARRASTVKHLLAQLDPSSRLRAALQEQQDHFLAVLKQATAEYQVRTQSKNPISS